MGGASFLGGAAPIAAPDAGFQAIAEKRGVQWLRPRRTATRRAAARSKATEASGLAGLARDGINGGNDWGRLRGLESVASPRDAPPTNFGVTGWTCGIEP